MPVDVFISYRGSDRVLARRLEQRLRSRWGSRVYRDETSLLPGHSWSEQLRDAMSKANVMLALIGPGWQLRDEGEDWVRDELLGAIEAGNPVLPVLAGDPDVLAERLTSLPEAFQLQAVKVRTDLAGFDLHQIERALRALGAFGERRAGGLGRELAGIVPDRADEVVRELLEGRSTVVAGASGSGRSALLRRIVAAAAAHGGLVAACGIDLASRSRRTHGVVAAWVDDLCEAIQGLAPEERGVLGPQLVNAVIDCGPDLLARKVLRPALLLPLGDDDSDQKILDAARRPTDRWAPFPPERLVSQSLNVIARFAAASALPVTLIVDNVESIDGSSRALLNRLLDAQPASVRLVLATSTVRERVEPESAQRNVARALRIDVNKFEGFGSISLHESGVWGAPGEIIRCWLERHEVRLGDGIGERLDSSNPYYALSALWYLVDNGHLVQEDVAEDVSPSDGSNGVPPGHDVVTWVAANPDEAFVIPERDRLLDHMVEEFVPVRFRSIIEAGSLIGRRFPFSAAFAATHPPESVDGQPPSTAAIERWRVAADTLWATLERIDPDGSVIVCHRSVDDERMISFAQVDLARHLTNGLDTAATRQLHERLARYFARPIAEDCGASFDDAYRDARAAATHWALAGRVRNAADAERVAAQLAERVLAYPEARRHYRTAIRLFTQLLARSEHRRTVNLVDHEDLLILANCLYRLGQMTRLAHQRGAAARGASDPTKYFRLALRRLKELSRNLHDKRLARPMSEELAAISRRDLPEPNVIRHHIRLCETLSGWVNLELAEILDQDDGEESRQLLFEALRHAEAARGEADSRWLLADASARLAEHLVEDAVQARFPDGVRAQNLAVEAQFHIERVIGLEAVSPDEDRDLEEPRSRAWMVLGLLFQALEVKPRLAEWAFRRMNDHRHDVSDLVDMRTDRRLGLFLLSSHRGTRDARTDEARTLLERHARWAVESGIYQEHSDAYLSLSLLELAERSRERSPSLEAARQYVDQAIDCEPDANQRQNALLLKGLLHAIERADDDGIAYDDEQVLAAFRAAGVDGLVATSSDHDVLHEGWRTLLLRLLRWCPHLEVWIGLEECLRRAPGQDGPGAARRRFFSELVLHPELQYSLKRAGTYLASVADGPLVPSNDTALWRLLRGRVPRECHEHAVRTRETAHALLRCHRDIGGNDMTRRTLLAQDIAYAVAVHEWYRSTDPSRLLTLAREGNLQIDGAEWASPRLLGGRLAVQVLDHQYGAGSEIGLRRLRQIESMVVNWAKGAEDAGPLEQIFYVAVQLHEPGHGSSDGALRVAAHQPGELSTAYRMALEERRRRVRQAGLRLVQELHLLDADTSPPRADPIDRPDVELDVVDPRSPNAARSDDSAAATRGEQDPETLDNPA